jgi:hypothetical protein
MTNHTHSKHVKTSESTYCALVTVQQFYWSGTQPKSSSLLWVKWPPYYTTQLHPDFDPTDGQPLSNTPLPKVPTPHNKINIQIQVHALKWG